MTALSAAASLVVKHAAVDQTGENHVNTRAVVAGIVSRWLHDDTSEVTGKG